MADPERSRGFSPQIRSRGLRRAPFADLYHSVLTSSWLGFFGGVVGAFLITNALFACGYLLDPGQAISGARPGSFEDAFFFSVQTMATIGYGTMAPATRYAHALVTIEALFGLLGMALVTGMTFSKFARPTARVLFGEKAVITERDGIPHLMFRMGNLRTSRILEAQLRVMLLVEVRTKEGDVMRTPIDIPLVRSTTAFFSMTWSAMHVVDEKSPFHGPDAFERLRAQKGEIFLSLVGTEETFAQTVHARYGYRLDDVVVGARFADVLVVEADGTRTIDFSRFHEVVRSEG